ncbi:MAG: hypothetical protein KDB22_04840 [Planctomycetales bacterium]|nr:hypothetical protein [Planctomycetales bacterium]
MQDLLLISSAIFLAGYVATFNHGSAVNSPPALAAMLATLVGCLPPLAFRSRLSNGAVRQLAVVAWRMGALIPAVGLVRFWDGDERNCFLTTLLACYFVALPLESWLLIRDGKRSTK